jgi:dihydropteroate synthase
VLSGPSRKSFLQLAVGARPPLERVWATAAAVAASIWQGAHIVRVHDVAAMVDVVRVTDQCVEQSDTL